MSSVTHVANSCGTTLYHKTICHMGTGTIKNRPRTRIGGAQCVAPISSCVVSISLLPLFEIQTLQLYLNSDVINNPCNITFIRAIMYVMYYVIVTPVITNVTILVRLIVLT
jgi:ABC-type transport system involved in Fe-S cluster assembly fused permease/ATPase subunit